MAAIYEDLEGRTVLVTGGATGIGAAVVMDFAYRSSSVGSLELDEYGARASPAAQPQVATVAFEGCDLRDIEALKASIDRVRTRCCAGIPARLVHVSDHVIGLRPACRLSRTSLSR